VDDLADDASDALEGVPRILVIGVGGAGGNAVANMVRQNMAGVAFAVVNTDAQALRRSEAVEALQIGARTTRGLGAGAHADTGRAAAEESLQDIAALLEGTTMVFITAGMGGGTGTGAAPVIARAAREAGILTVAVVTKPFQFEGAARMRRALDGIAELERCVDTLIVIPNQNLFRVASEQTTLLNAFQLADEVLAFGVRSMTDLMVTPGLINLDFADVRAVISAGGRATMGTGEGQGERRALDAAEAAISNPLLEEDSMRGARGVLVNVIGGPDITLFEIDAAVGRIREEVAPDANIIFGSSSDEALAGRVRISVVATGIGSEEDPAFAEAAAPPVATVRPDPAQAGAAVPGGASVAPPVFVAAATLPPSSARFAEEMPLTATWDVRRRVPEEGHATPRSRTRKRALVRRLAEAWGIILQEDASSEAARLGADADAPPSGKLGEAPRRARVKG
jgi:cell division protein FtsZ